MFQFWNILDSQPINENTITLGETVSDPAIYSSVHNTNSKKVCLESSQKREAERISKKMLPKALYLSICSFIKNKQQELCMQEYKGICDGTSWVPGSEAWLWVLMQQEPLQPTKLLTSILWFHDKHSSISQITRTLKAWGKAGALYKYLCTVAHPASITLCFRITAEPSPLYAKLHVF